MKAFFRTVLLTLALFLTACGTSPAITGGNMSPSLPISTAAPESAPTADGHLASQFLEAFRALAADGETRSAEEMANALVQMDFVPFAGAVMEVEPGYLAGFDTEIKGFTAGASFGPMIGAIPCIGYIFDLASDGESAAFTETLRKNANLRWNVCTAADELLCEAVGSRVFFVMAPERIED